MSSDRDDLARIIADAWWQEAGNPSDPDAAYAESPAFFDRVAGYMLDLLAARDRRVRAEAWDEACEHDAAVCRGGHCAYNPYRADRIEEGA